MIDIHIFPWMYKFFYRHSITEAYSLPLNHTKNLSLITRACAQHNASPLISLLLPLLIDSRVLVLGHHRLIHFGPADWTVLAAGTALKLVLYFFCVRLRSRSDSMAALAEDHVNDVFRLAQCLYRLRDMLAIWSNPALLIFLYFLQNYPALTGI